jgi:hypothetical protein
MTFRRIKSVNETALGDSLVYQDVVAHSTVSSVTFALHAVQDYASVLSISEKIDDK